MSSSAAGGEGAVADARGIIRVDIIGDSKGLQTELKKGGAAFGAIAAASGIATGALIGFAERGLAAAVDFLGGSIAEADRLGDALTRLQTQLPGFEDDLESIADDFERFGISKQDGLELIALFADLGTAAGIADPLIATLADEVLATAGAMSLITDLTPDQIVEAIGKAADGAEKPLKLLGIALDENAVNAAALELSGKGAADELTEGELAAGRLVVILDELKPRLDAVAESEADVESKGRELQARMETLQGVIGQKLEPVALQMLEWLDDLFVGIGFVAYAFGTLPGAIAGVQRGIEDILSPLARLVDLLAEFGRLVGLEGGGAGSRLFDPGDLPAGGPSGRGAGPARVTVNVNGGDPIEVQRAVTTSLRGYGWRNGVRMFD
jgi:hypothetical protein